MTGIVPTWLAETVSTFGAACKDKLNGPGEPEDAIRSPLEALLTSVGSELGLVVIPHGEAALKELGVRPDYAVRVDGAITGYIEVKKPKLSIDPADFHGANLKQWTGLKDLPNLLYTNGSDWRLYQNGALVAEAALDKDLRKDGSALKVPGPEFEHALRSFFHWNPVPITSVARLVTVIAPLCRQLRAAVVEQLADERKAAKVDAEDSNQLFTALARDWRNLLFPTADDDTFADGYAQAVTFALLLARTEDIDLAGKGLHEIGQKLGPDHSLMGKALQILTDGVPARFEATLDMMVRVVGAVDWPQIRAAKADAYLHLYEDFLGEYDEELRKQSGSYYTPREVVAQMVRLTDEVLRTRLGCDQGYLSPNVLTVDPAMGTGTYLHAVIKHVADQIAETTGPGAQSAAIGELAEKLVGFELQMGPFAVAELRASDLLKRYGATVPHGGMKMYVTNTLDDPHLEQTQLAAGYEPIAKSRRAANKIKASTPVTVVIGNPPYRERAQDEGGWVERGALNVTAPLDSFRLEGNGRFEYVLKNLYVYFWRWAAWKVFDAHPDDSHGVVCFITTSGYLRGPGFKGMRRYLREVCDEGWIINVSPEGMRPDVPTRVFPGVQQPLAIGIFVRKSNAGTTEPASIRYTEVTGRRAGKYAKLQELTLDGSQWRAARTGWEAPFTPAALSEWDDYPALGDLLPWHAPGIKPNRTWVYAPAPAILRARWASLISESDPEAKRAKFKPSDSRDLDSVVDPLAGAHKHSGTIGAETGACPEPLRVGFRSFDRQWIIPDSRLMHRPSPELWDARRAGQIFLVEHHAIALSSGPGVVYSGLIPDMHFFKGSEGGRVLPMLHPDGTPNLAPGLVEAIEAIFGASIDPQEVAAYIAGVVSHPAFTARFSDELVTPGIRVPITADPQLWAEAVALGQQVIWASTYGTVFHNAVAGRPQGSVVYPAGDPRRPKMLKQLGNAMPETIRYDTDSETLHVGEAMFGPVPERVWLYDTGGMPVVNKWFSYRKAKPGGKKTSLLDGIHAEGWPLDWIQEFLELLTALRRLVELESAQSDLLERVLLSTTITVSDLTQASVFPVSAQAGKIRRTLSTENAGDGALF